MFHFTMLGSQIDLHFWNRLPNDLASASASASRLPVEIHVQLRCYCCGRKVGNIGALQNINFAMETKAKKFNSLSSY